MEIDVRFAHINLSDEEAKIISECPYEIKDPHKYLESVRLEQQSKKIQFTKTSDGRVIDLFKNKINLIADWMDLPDEEQIKIEKKQKVFRTMQQKAANMKRMSLGNVSKDGTPIKEKNKPIKNSLLSEKKAEILEYFGRMYTVREVFSMIRMDWNIKSISEVLLSDFYRENLDEIQRLQSKHKNDHSHLRLTAKTSRLEELTYLYGKLKRVYEKNGSREDHKTLLSTMESIRKEVEGDKLTIQGSMNIQLQQDVNIHIKNELMKNLSLKEIILSRLSARLNQSPIKLLSSLNKSYYAKLNRLISDTETVEFEEMIYPSAQSYDFDNIQKINAQRQIELKVEEREEQQIKIKAQQDSEDKDNKKIIKERLMKKLRDNLTSLSNQQLNIQRDIYE